MEKIKKELSDNSLDHSSEEENEEDNPSGFFNRNNEVNDSTANLNINEPSAILKENTSNNTSAINFPFNDNSFSQNQNQMSDIQYNQYTATQSDPNTDMINHPNYYKKFVRDPGVEGRKASRILFLRSFNNWVKATLINKTSYLLGKELSVLDLCCGRGGDLEKYFRNRIKVYVGADLSDESLRNAMDRIIKLKSEKFKELNTKCFFITEDISDPDNNLQKKIPSEVYFDLVSCQFAMHYHFESEINVRAFLQNVTSKLNEGGYFIGTIVDSDVLVKRLRSRKYKGNKYIAEKFTFGNEFYSVKCYQKRFPVKKGPYGIKYGFYLEDSIDKRDEHGKIKYVAEYLVIFQNFVNLCKEYDLHLVDKKNLTEFYAENMENKYYRTLFRKMIKELEVQSKEMQWEIIGLYQAFTFRKGQEKDKESRGNYKNNNKKRYQPVLKNVQLNFKDNNPEFIEDQFE